MILVGLVLKHQKTNDLGFIWLEDIRKRMILVGLVLRHRKMYDLGLSDSQTPENL